MTVIDALVVTLGLDASGWRRGREEAGKDLKGLKDEAAAASKTVSTLAKTAAELFAVFLGGRALKEFVEDVTQANTQLERLSRNTNTSVRELQSWGQVTARNGGTAQGFQGTLTGLSKQLTEIAVTGQSSVLPYFRALGVHLGDARGHARPLTDILTETLDKLAALPDRQLANNLGLMMGIDQGTLNAGLDGTLRQQLARQRELNPLTEQAARDSRALANAMYDAGQASEGVGRVFLEFVTPALTRFFELVTRGMEWLRQHQAVLAVIAGTLAVAFAPAVWAAATAVWALLAPILLLAAPILAVGAALALLADDWNVWRKGGKAALGDTWDYWNDLWKKVGGSGPQVQDALHKALGFVYDFLHGLWTGDAMGANSIVDNLTNGFELLKQGGPHSTGQQRQAAMDELMREGYSWDQAAGITAALNAEGQGLDPGATNPTSGAYGVGQWLGVRKRNLAAFAASRGMDPSQLMTQLLFRREEENPASPYADAGAVAARRAILGTQDSSAAASAYLQMNERPGPGLGGDLDRVKTGLWLLNMSRQPSASDRGGSTSTTSNRSSEVNVGEVHVHTQATDAHGMARGAAGALRDQLADQADSGLW